VTWLRGEPVKKKKKRHKATVPAAEQAEVEEAAESDAATESEPEEAASEPAENEDS
jgi:hypothetical protein